MTSTSWLIILWSSRTYATQTKKCTFSFLFRNVRYLMFLNGFDMRNFALILLLILSNQFLCSWFFHILMKLHFLNIIFPYRLYFLFLCSKFHIKCKVIIIIFFFIVIFLNLISDRLINIHHVNFIPTFIIKVFFIILWTDVQSILIWLYNWFSVNRWKIVDDVDVIELGGNTRSILVVWFWHVCFLSLIFVNIIYFNGNF